MFTTFNWSHRIMHLMCQLSDAFINPSFISTPAVGFSKPNRINSANLRAEKNEKNTKEVCIIQLKLTKLFLRFSQDR